MILYEGDVLRSNSTNYVVTRFLGKGTFGQVVEATDRRSGHSVAIKVVKNRRPYLAQAKQEVDIYKIVNKFYDAHRTSSIVRLLTAFKSQSHLCLVFPKVCTLFFVLFQSFWHMHSLNLTQLSWNFYDVMKANQYSGFQPSFVRVFTV